MGPPPLVLGFAVEAGTGIVGRGYGKAGRERDVD